eukprot:m.455677 g.455677  ORF g.455677 m.455677 type:complete len:293 (-) comp20919_c0_seq1:249-1127(-)
MMYLEDFVESIETLPQDMKHYFSHMRSLDLKGANAYQDVNTKFKRLCAAAADPINPPSQAELDAAYAEVTKDFQLAFEQADEKIQLAEQTYDIMDRQIRRIDIELKKYKADLEQNKPGSTAQLLQQSLELDESNTSLADVERESTRRPAARHRHSSTSRVAETTSPTYAEVQAVTRTSPFAAHSAVPQQAAVVLSPPQHRRQNAYGAESGMAAVPMEIASEVQTIVEGPPANPDPNEPRYCYCNEVSYGEMVGCDNDNCESGEWFHYKCVGLTEEPNGTWYCFECRLEMEGK